VKKGAKKYAEVTSPRPGVQNPTNTPKVGEWGVSTKTPEGPRQKKMKKKKKGRGWDATFGKAGGKKGGGEQFDRAYPGRRSPRTKTKKQGGQVTSVGPNERGD